MQYFRCFKPFPGKIEGLKKRGPGAIPSLGEGREGFIRGAWCIPALGRGKASHVFRCGLFFLVLKKASPYVATKVTKKASAEMLLCRTRP